MMYRRTKFYIDKRQAKLMGVCAGIADYFGWDILVVRLITFVLGVFALPPFIIPAYILIGWLAPHKPTALYDTGAEDEAFWRSARVAPGRTIRDSRSRFRDIDRRLSDIETYVTSPSRRLSTEIDNLR
jgi:phage shock protein C